MCSSDHQLCKPTDGLRGCILSNAKILVGIVRGYAIGEYLHCRRYLLICTKPHDTGGGSTTFKVIGGGLTIGDNLDKQTTTHSVPSAEETRRVCRYLREVVLHQMLVSESAVPVDGESPDEVIEIILWAKIMLTYEINQIS